MQEKNPETLKFVSDHHKIKKMSKNAQDKTREVCDKVILENAGRLMFAPIFYNIKKICNKAVGNYAHTSEFFADYYETKKNLIKWLILLFLQ